MSHELATTNPPFMVGPTHFGNTGQVYIGRYSNGTIALSLLDPEDGDPVLTASVNMVNDPLPDRRHVWLKGWSENQGIPAAMVAAGVVELTGKTVKAGFVHAEQAKLTKRFIEALPANVREYIEGVSVNV